MDGHVAGFAKIVILELLSVKKTLTVKNFFKAEDDPVLFLVVSEKAEQGYKTKCFAYCVSTKIN